MKQVSRRQLLLTGTTAGLLSAAGATAARAATATVNSKSKFGYCLNMSTIRGQNLPVEQEIDIAGKAGYDGIEPWLNKLHEYVRAGKSLKDLRKRIADHGLKVESAIGFARWIVDDDARRAMGLEDAKRDMDIIAEIGGTRIAAPPAGVPRGKAVTVDNAAKRYRKLLELGDKTGVVPQVEMWGGNASIGTLSKAIYVAVASGHPQACFLGDIYHTYKGGSDFSSLRLLGPHAMQVFHVNDYPADPPRATIRDEHRVYPGDGIAPMTKILSTFLAVGATPALSLELFNREYWKQDALQVAKTGLQKMKDAVAKLG